MEAPIRIHKINILHVYNIAPQIQEVAMQCLLEK